MRPCFVFWFFWGSEVRVYALSGLLDYLSSIGDVVVLTRYRNSDLERAISREVRWVEIPILKAPKWWSSLHTFCNRLHGDWLEARYDGLAVRDHAATQSDVRPFRHRLSAKLAGRVGSQRTVTALSVTLNRLLSPYLGGAKAVLKASVGTGASLLITSDYLSGPGAMIALAASSYYLPTVFYPSNWRDIYKGARISSPYASLLMWNREMAETAIRNNPWLRDVPLQVVGSTQFDAHFRQDWLLSRDAFCGRLGLDPARPIACYSVVNDRAYRGEAETAFTLMKELHGRSEGRQIQVLFRLNPAGSDPAYQEIEYAYPGSAVVLKPDWWIAGGDGTQPRWSSNTGGDALLFANIIQHCFVNVGLPSTVMLDFAVRGKPSCCVGFDGPRNVSGRASRAIDFLNQDFFQLAVARNVWDVARDVVGLADLIAAYASGMRAPTSAMRDYVLRAVGACDGKVHERVGSCLHQILLERRLLSHTKTAP